MATYLIQFVNKPACVRNSNVFQLPPEGGFSNFALSIPKSVQLCAAASYYNISRNSFNKNNFHPTSSFSSFFSVVSVRDIIIKSYKKKIPGTSAAAAATSVVVVLLLLIYYEESTDSRWDPRIGSRVVA